MTETITPLVEETTDSQTYTKVPRTELVAALRARDGKKCMHPDCSQKLDFDITEGPLEVTIDHWMPQCFGKANGWTMDQIWDLTNLRLMHKKCNAKKGDLIPNEDGTLPKKPQSTFKFRRQKRAERPEICESCNAGRNLQDDEWCNSCGSGPQPARYPKWRQMSPKDCDHDLFFCWGCVLEPEQRRSVMDTLMTGGNGYE